MKKYTLPPAPSIEKISPSTGDLQLAFDVGHSSIGWAVLQSDKSASPTFLGTGVVTFSADDCLASQRRAFRRQRRHIRATRQRISRIERLLIHLGVISEEKLSEKHKQGGGHSAPWLLAARVLRGGGLLTWEQLWDVLRWYAHNRGYDGNKAWSSHEIEAEKENTEKVERARNLLSDFEKKYGRQGSMAEVFCDVSGLDPLGTKISCNLPGDKRPKALNAAFPREDVEREVRAILEKHVGKLPKLDAAFITALLENWTVLPCDSIRLPGRYGQILSNGKRSPGGLLFGQLIPRFENRIIATCPITFERVYQSVMAKDGDIAKAKHEGEKLAKVPAKDCPEFFRFRWAMQVANIQVATGEGRKTRTLSIDERNRLDAKMRERGFFTPKQFKDAVREITGGAPDNIDQMLTHPDADKALVLDPARKAISRAPWDTLFPLLSEQVQKRALGRLRRGRAISLASLSAEALADFDAAIETFLSAANTKKTRRQTPVTRGEILAATASCDALTGRAPYSRAIMKEATDFVLTTDRHPTEEGGPLYRSDAIRAAQLQRAIDEQTNNHLVRHRLLILERLHRDILKEFAGDKPGRIARVTIEVNRDLRELSGKTAKQVAQDIGQRLANFKSVTARLEKAFAGKSIRITPGLIRKARIAEDLGWKCPYTGKDYDEFDLLYRKVDKDHIIPRSERASDSLDSLVITFAEVNKMKGKRTAVRFVEDCAGQTVEGRPELSIKTLPNFFKDVAALETFKGHDDDKRRKKRRKEMLQLRDYVEKEFTPRDLTQTSQLVRLGAQMLERAYTGQEKKPVITSLPGSVTGAVRKSWNLLGCIATANPLVINKDDLDEQGKPKIHNKTEIRGITHLHHALDACVLALTSLFFPRDGGVWELLAKRRLNVVEQTALKERLGHYVEFTQDGETKLLNLPTSLKEQIRLRLAERRVVQHIPKEMTGLPAQLNAWRVERIEGKRVWLHQHTRQPDGTRKKVQKDVDESKVIGLNPLTSKGKLQTIKGALILDSNYGIAILDHAERLTPSGGRKRQAPNTVVEMVPFHKVWNQVEKLKVLNKGHNPRMLRCGQIIHVPRGTHTGCWRIFSVKNNSDGKAVSLGEVDAPHCRNDKQNVRVSTLLRDGMEILHSGLCGNNDFGFVGVKMSPFGILPEGAAIKAKLKITPV